MKIKEYCATLTLSLWIYHPQSFVAFEDVSVEGGEGPIHQFMPKHIAWGRPGEKDFLAATESYGQ